MEDPEPRTKTRKLEVLDIRPSADGDSLDETQIENAWREQLQGVSDPAQSIRPVTVVGFDTENSDTPTAVFDGPPQGGPRPESFSGRLDMRRHRIEAPAEDGSAVDAGDYAILDEIGKGGMGRVYRARQLSLGREIAIKRLKEGLDLPDGHEQFENEARITAMLDHVNIVPVHEMGVDQNGTIFYTMKLLQGTPWGEQLSARPEADREGAVHEGLAEDLREHLKILLEVSQALAFAHSRKVLHRDLKPDNVMVGDYGQVTVVDWGLGVCLETSEASRGLSDLSQVPITCGTPTYMAPETARGKAESIGPWTDVYQLGAILFELLYGVTPHVGDTAMEVLKVAARNRWAFPTEIPPAMRPYHEVMKPIVGRALDSDPDERFPDAKAFGAAVEGAIRHLDSVAASARAGDQLAFLEKRNTVSYREVDRVVVALEQALSSWEGNAEARATLSRATLFFAEVAMRKGDLGVVQSLLDRMREGRPEYGLDEEAVARMDAVANRFTHAKRDEERRRFINIGLQVSAAFMLLVMIVVGVYSFVAVRRARDRIEEERNHLSQLMIETAADGIEAELDGLFNPVRSNLQIARRWGTQGRLETDDPEALKAMFLPIMRAFPVVSLVTRADAAGHEWVLVRDGDGWTARMTAPGEVSRWWRYDAMGDVVEEYTKSVDYDPHTRPWYEGALALRESGAPPDTVHWTTPYTFFTNQKAGISASIPVTGPTGREMVVGFDILLTDISELTMQMPQGSVGKVFVLADGDRVVGLPRASRFDDEGVRDQSVLQELGKVGEPISAAALRAWDERDRRGDASFRLEAEGQAWWTGFRTFELGEDRRFWIGVVLPESDFMLTHSQQ